MLRAILSVLAVCLVTGNALAQNYRQAGDWIVRAGLGVVAPDGDGSDISAGNGLGLPPGNVDVDDGYAATITVAYMVTDHIGVELLASTPFNHDIDYTGLGDIAETDHLPPTLSLQYHFGPFGRIQPYVGAGVNYTIFFNEDTKGAANGTTLNLEDSVGLAVQGGFDWHFGNNWLVNADFRWIDIEPKGEINGVDIGDVEIDPYVVSLNVGYNF